MRVWFENMRQYLVMAIGVTRDSLAVPRVEARFTGELARHRDTRRAAVFVGQEEPLKTLEELEAWALQFAAMEMGPEARFEAFLRTRQEGSVHAYVQAFRLAVGHFIKWPTVDLLCVFKRGLQPAIRARLVEKMWPTLTEAYAAAVEAEAQLKRAVAEVTARRPSGGPQPMELDALHMRRFTPQGPRRPAGQPQPTQGAPPLRCFACGQVGHTRRVCPTRVKAPEQVN